MSPSSVWTMPCSQAASVEPSSCTIRWAACQSPAASRSTARRRSRSAMSRDHSRSGPASKPAGAGSGYKASMDILHDALGFAARGFIVLATIALTVLFCVAVLRRRRPPRSWLRVKRLNRQIEVLGDALRGNVMKKNELRKLRKNRKKLEAGRPAAKPSVFVLEFKGDLFATA